MKIKRDKPKKIDCSISHSFRLVVLCGLMGFVSYGQQGDGVETATSGDDMPSSGVFAAHNGITNGLTAAADANHMSSLGQTRNLVENTRAFDTTYAVAAYVWPSLHNEERSRKEIWPEGIGEWEVIKKGTPRFEGHYQPKVPLWGYQQDDDPEVMRQWINAASEHGVNVFIFDWYWFDGKPFLENSLNNGFLKAPNNDKMKFYLMWANHDVKRNYWNVHLHKDDDSQLFEGAVNLDDFKNAVDRVITRYFVKENYFKFDGKPIFSIFSLKNLIEGLGGKRQTLEALNHFRTETKKAGFPNLHLQAIVFGNPNEDVIADIDFLGFDSVTKYNWGGPHPQDYIRWGNEALMRRSAWDASLDIPYFPNASIGWDDTPRFPLKDKSHVVHYNKSPKTFAYFLQKAKDYVDDRPEQEKLITVFSWNEWIEGGYLLPDAKYEFGYLEAVRRVMAGKYKRY